MISIRRQLTRRLLGTTLGLLGLGLTALVALACHAVVNQFDGALYTKALAVSTVVQVSGESVKVGFTDRFLRGFDDDDPSDYFQMWRWQGEEVARSESLRKQPDLLRRVGRLERPRYFLCTLPNGRPGRAIGFRFRPKLERGDDRNLELELVVATDREDLDETLGQLLALAAGCAGLLAAASIWVVPRVLRRGLAPLEQLGEQAAKIDASSLAERFPLADLPEELRPIAERFNALLARLEESFERERRFSGDLAHELRTPIAELRSLAECALKWPETREAMTDREVLAIARHMESLTTSMLALARGGPPVSQIEAIELDKFVAEVWTVFAKQTKANQLTVSLILAPIQVAMDRTLLRSILTNLFENAVEYTPTGGKLTVVLSTKDDGVTLNVANLAPNLDAADVLKLFDPFWRKEAARTGGQHVGLGLSLARSFASAMGWTITATLDEQRHLVISFRGPVLFQSRSGMTSGQ